MSKSMEVVIQSLEDRMDLGAKARRLMKAKRFTDAELAAEWQANEVEAWQMVSRLPEHYDVSRAEEIESREVILRRFARLPHYDERPAT